MDSFLNCLPYLIFGFCFVYFGAKGVKGSMGVMARMFLIIGSFFSLIAVGIVVIPGFYSWVTAIVLGGAILFMGWNTYKMRETRFCATYIAITAILLMFFIGVVQTTLAGPV